MISKKVLEDDPYHIGALPAAWPRALVRSSSGARLLTGDAQHDQRALAIPERNAIVEVVFYVAHQLMNAYPSTAIAWFTAGEPVGVACTRVWFWVHAFKRKPFPKPTSSISAHAAPSLNSCPLRARIPAACCKF